MIRKPLPYLFIIFVCSYWGHPCLSRLVWWSAKNLSRANRRFFGENSTAAAQGKYYSILYGDDIFLLYNGTWKCIRGRYVQYVEWLIRKNRRFLSFLNDFSCIFQKKQYFCTTFWMTYTIRIIPMCKHLGWEETLALLFSIACIFFFTTCIFLL